MNIGDNKEAVHSATADSTMSTEHLRSLAASAPPDIVPGPGPGVTEAESTPMISDSDTQAIHCNSDTSPSDEKFAAMRDLHSDFTPNNPPEDPEEVPFFCGTQCNTEGDKTSRQSFAPCDCKAESVRRRKRYFSELPSDVQYWPDWYCNDMRAYHTKKLANLQWSVATTKTKRKRVKFQKDSKRIQAALNTAATYQAARDKACGARQRNQSRTRPNFRPKRIQEQFKKRRLELGHFIRNRDRVPVVNANYPDPTDRTLAELYVGTAVGRAILREKARKLYEQEQSTLPPSKRTPISFEINPTVIVDLDEDEATGRARARAAQFLATMTLAVTLMKTLALFLIRTVIRLCYSQAPNNSTTPRTYFIESNLVLTSNIYHDSEEWLLRWCSHISSINLWFPWSVMDCFEPDDDFYDRRAPNLCGSGCSPGTACSRSNSSVNSFAYVCSRCDIRGILCPFNMTHHYH
jgi:hypothetical protein